MSLIIIYNHLSLDTIMLTSLAPHSLLFPCKEGAGRSTYLCPCPLSIHVQALNVMKNWLALIQRGQSLEFKWNRRKDLAKLCYAIDRRISHSFFKFNCKFIFLHIFRAIEKCNNLKIRYMFHKLVGVRVRIWCS